MTVERSEQTSAVLLALHAFLLLAAYGSIKPVREALVLVLLHGAEYKIYSGVVVSIATACALPLYARYATKAPRDRLIIGLTLFFAANLVGFYGWGRFGGATVFYSLTFYVWISIFSVMIVAQFWAFANDVYGPVTAERVFPLVGAGASLGAVAGSWLAGELVSALGRGGMLLLGAGLLVVSAPLIEVVHRRALRHPSIDHDPSVLVRPVAERSHVFRAVVSDRYLTLIAVFAVLFTMLRTNGEYILATLAKHAAEVAVRAGTLRAGDVGSYIATLYARFNLYVDIAALVLQSFVVSRVLRRFGFAVAFLAFPVVAILGSAAIALLPVLAVAFPARVVENAVDYSLLNTTRNLLWQQTTRQAKYIAKQAVDTFFVRAGDATSALLVFLAADLAALSTRTLVAANLCLGVATLVCGRAVLRARARLVASPPCPSDPGVPV